tara:strand:+ start:1789 stop:2034 length:246 start_codon:yes stop_codon:yes gene_type:complete
MGLSQVRDSGLLCLRHACCRSGDDGCDSCSDGSERRLKEERREPSGDPPTGVDPPDMGESGTVLAGVSLLVDHICDGIRCV